MSDEVLKLPQVLARVGLSRSTWLQGVKRRVYPAPIRLSERRVGWTAASIDAWLADREAAIRRAA